MYQSLGNLIDQELASCAWAERFPPEVRDLPIGDADAKAAWELYIEFVTRITTQPLEDEEGAEIAALESVQKLFPIARDLMRRSGREAPAFSALALALLNYRVRPFTAAWHTRAKEGRLRDPAVCGRFRDELRDLQLDLRIAADVLANLARVPRLSDYSAP